MLVVVVPGEHTSLTNHFSPIMLRSSPHQCYQRVHIMHIRVIACKYLSTWTFVIAEQVSMFVSHFCIVTEFVYSAVVPKHPKIMLAGVVISLLTVRCSWPSRSCYEAHVFDHRTQSYHCSTVVVVVIMSGRYTYGSCSNTQSRLADGRSFPAVNSL